MKSVIDSGENAHHNVDTDYLHFLRNMPHHRQNFNSETCVVFSTVIH